MLKKREVTYQVSSLSRYLREIGQTPLLNKEQEHALSDRIQDGDGIARKQMMEANLRLVVSIAKQYVPSNDPELMMDLIQEGNIGLMKSVDRFKSEFDTRFSTYAVYWIRQAILRALKSRRLVRLPENVVDKIAEMQKVRQRLYQVLGRPPMSEELSKEMGVSVREIDRLEGVSSNIVSLDSMVSGREDEDGIQLGRILEDLVALHPGQVAQASMIRDEVKQAVESLPPREKKIIDLRFGLTDNQPHTLEEIGEVFNISRERVRQLQNVALHRLRHRDRVQETDPSL